MLRSVFPLFSSEKAGFGRYYLYSLFLAAFLLPLARIPTMVSVPLMFAALFWLLEGSIKEKTGVLLQSKRMWPLPVLYLLYTTGVLYSDNMQNAFFDLQVKFSLMGLPLLVCRPRRSRPLPVIKLIDSFVAGCLTATLLCFLHALYRFFVDGSMQLTYISFSVFMHPGYFSVYLDLAITALLTRLAGNGMGGPTARRLVVMAGIILMTVAVALLESRSGILILVMILCVFSARAILSRSAGKKHLLLGLSAILLAAATVAILMPAAFHRVTGIRDELGGKHGSAYMRVAIWESALDLSLRHPLAGVGTGDVKDSLLEEYRQRGIDAGVSRGLNAHNQYLQTFLALGVPGLAVLAAGLLLPFFQGRRRLQFLPGVFLAIMSVNFLTEAFLEVQAGVVFYALFYPLLAVNYDEDSPSS